MILADVCCTSSCLRLVSICTSLTDNKMHATFRSVLCLKFHPKQYITTDCKNQIAHIFSEKPETRKPLLELAETTIGHPDHPFKASILVRSNFRHCLWSERDLSWSEHIRLNRESFEKRLIRFEETCRM